MKLAVYALTLLAIAATPLPLARWQGAWHLDRAASRFRGDVTRIERVPGGYRFDLGAVRFMLPDDGAFHATVPGRETRLARLAPGRWEREQRVNGHLLDRSVLTLSDDDRTLTIAGEHPGAAPERLRREGAGTGLAGRWRSTRLGINAAETLAIAATGDRRLRWGSPAEGNWYVVAADGRRAANQGPTASPIATLEVRGARDGSLRWTERLNGKPSRRGIERLATGGTTLTETTWPADDSAERQVLVYRRGADANP